MKIEDQVCSIEIARKLKEVGVKQDSLFAWAFVKNDFGNDWLVVSNDYSLTDVYSTDWCSAFTVAELGEMLPYHLDVSYPTSYLHTVKVEDDAYRCAYCDNMGVVGRDSFRLQFAETNEANARAKMLIYLLENKLIDSKNLVSSTE